MRGQKGDLGHLTIHCCTADQPTYLAIQASIMETVTPLSHPRQIFPAEETQRNWKIIEVESCSSYLGRYFNCVSPESSIRFSLKITAKDGTCFLVS